MLGIVAAKHDLRDPWGIRLRKMLYQLDHRYDLDVLGIHRLVVFQHASYQDILRLEGYGVPR